jgi:hypothetical protein
MIGFFDQFNLTGSQNHLPSRVAILRGFYQKILIKKVMRKNYNYEIHSNKQK